MTHLLTWIVVVVILALLAVVILATIADSLEPLRRRWWRYRHWRPEERAWLARTRRTLDEERKQD